MKNFVNKDNELIINVNVQQKVLCKTFWSHRCLVSNSVEFSLLSLSTVVISPIEISMSFSLWQLIWPTFCQTFQIRSDCPHYVLLTGINQKWLNFKVQLRSLFQGIKAFRYLSRFFDCLAHPNLSATLATDQKWSKVVFVVLTKV